MFKRRKEATTTSSNQSLAPISGPPHRRSNNNNNNSRTSLQKTNSKRLNVDKDESGFYKAKHNQNDAKTVNDGEHVVTEMPADFRRASIVSDEVKEILLKHF
jgi:hypothetical protein